MSLRDTALLAHTWNHPLRRIRVYAAKLDTARIEQLTRNVSENAASLAAAFCSDDHLYLTLHTHISYKRFLFFIINFNIIGSASHDDRETRYVFCYRISDVPFIYFIIHIYTYSANVPFFTPTGLSIAR